MEQIGIQDLALLFTRLFGSVPLAVGMADATSAVGWLDDADKAWGINQWQPNVFGQGFSMEIVAGTGTGQSREIISNTATRLFPRENFVTAPDDTSEYIIYRNKFSYGASVAGGLTVGYDSGKEGTPLACEVFVQTNAPANFLVYGCVSSMDDVPRYRLCDTLVIAAPAGGTLQEPYYTAYRSIIVITAAANNNVIEITSNGNFI